MNKIILLILFFIQSVIALSSEYEYFDKFGFGLDLGRKSKERPWRLTSEGTSRDKTGNNRSRIILENYEIYIIPDPAFYDDYERIYGTIPKEGFYKTTNLALDSGFNFFNYRNVFDTYSLIGVGLNFNEGFSHFNGRFIIGAELNLENISLSLEKVFQGAITSDKINGYNDLWIGIKYYHTIKYYNPGGYNKMGYNREGYNKSGYDKNGLTKQDKDKDDKNIYQKKEFIRNNYMRKGKSLDGILYPGMTKEKIKFYCGKPKSTYKSGDYESWDYDFIVKSLLRESYYSYSLFFRGDVLQRWTEYFSE